MMVIEWSGWYDDLFVDWLPDDLERVDKEATTGAYARAGVMALLQRWPGSYVLMSWQWRGAGDLSPLPQPSLAGQTNHPDVEMIGQIAHDVYIRGGWEVYH